MVNQRQKGIPFCFCDISIDTARIRSPKHSLLWRRFMAILYRILPSNGKVFHGYVLCSFRDSCPGFISFRQNTPCVGSRRGTAQGAALLTKWGETAIIKAERALLLVVSFAVLHHIIMNNADRLAATERSARFYGQVCKTPCVGSRSGTAQGMQRS